MQAAGALVTGEDVRGCVTLWMPDVQPRVSLLAQPQPHALEVGRDGLS